MKKVLVVYLKPSIMHELGFSSVFEAIANTRIMF